jgi:tetratricopeptide (TPR) repeat protein
MLQRTITHYEVLEMVGQGGMGTVYKARDTRLQRLVALKFLTTVGTSAEARQRILREGQALSALSHPNIATVYEAGEDAGEVFLALEYLPGGSLDRRLRAARESGSMLPLHQVAEWGASIVSALAHAHRHGVIHRDVKPGNVLFDREGRVKLSDFGLATTPNTEAHSADGRVMGTLPYMPPEVLRGAPADARSDLYSLGVMLFEMATGQTPFRGGTESDVLQKTLGQPAPAPSTLRPGLPAGFDRLVTRLLAKRPEDRPREGDRVARELLAAVQGAPTPAPEETPTATMPVWTGAPPGRQRMRVAAAVAVTLLAALGALSVSSRLGKPPAPEKVQVAVLPFRSIGGDAGQAAFCDGLTETVTTVLSKHGEFSVVPAPDARNLDSAEKARKEFGVNLVVYASLQRRGDQVRLIITLIDAKKRRQIDSQPIDWPVARMMELEDSVMVKIGDLLSLVTTPAPGARLARVTQMPSAYDAYLRGRGYLYRYDRPGNLDRALGEFQEAVRLDTSFAAAYVGIAETNLRAYRLRQEQTLLDAARAAAEQARTLNPNLAAAHLALARALVELRRTGEAATELETALRLDPQDAEVYRELGRLYSRAGRFAEADQTYQKALAARPNDWMVATFAATDYASRQRLDVAEKLYRQAAQLSPDNHVPYRNLGTLLVMMGRNREGEQMLLKAQQLNPTAVGFANLAALYMMERRYAEAVPAARKGAELAPVDSPAAYRVWGNLGDAYWLAGGRPATRPGRVAQGRRTGARPTGADPE